MSNININSLNMSELTTKAFMDCLFKEGEDTTNNVSVEGLTSIYRLHPERLEEKRELVINLLAELPAQFKDGYTFLNICTMKDGKQWTGSHHVCEQLVVMAIGLGLMEYCTPRKMWTILPGSVPYLRIK